MPGLLAGVWGPWAYALGLTVVGTGSTELIAGAALAAASLLVMALSLRLAAVRPPGAGRPARPRAVADERAGRAKVSRLRDPDASGRVRPRAPSAHPRAA